MLPPTGPFAVGCRDFTWRLGTAPIDAHNNVTGRLFYPAAAGAKGGSVNWIQDMMYAKGYVTFAFFSAKSLKWRIAKNVLQGAAWASGAATRMPVLYNAPLAFLGSDPFPLVIFSPGAAANRNTYSSVCTEVASRGCVVVAVEHADGSSGAALLADGTWKLFAGLGTGPVLEAKCHYRVAEVMSAVQIMRSLNEAGSVAEGSFVLSGDGKDGGAQASFKGALDLSKLTVMGHSCGGATAALAASQHPEFAAAVAMDPWWTILPSGSPALTQWAPGCTTPLQIIGSDDWNTPKGIDGSLPCDGPRQEAVLEAARHRDDGSGSGRGGGALLVVPAHTKHHSFSDVPALLEGSAVARRVLAVMGIKPDPISAAASLRLICECAVRFCRAHYAAGGPWPAAGGITAAAEVEAEGAAAAAAAASGGGGREGETVEKVLEGVVTDEAAELAVEEHASGNGPPPQHNGHRQGGDLTEEAAASRAVDGVGAAAAVAAAAAGAAHVRVWPGEMEAYAKFKEEGLLRILEVHA